MKLETEEKEQVTKLVDQYRSVHDEIKLIEESMRKLTEAKDLVINKLYKIRDTEAELKETLKEKYGDGKLDPRTLEWIKK